LHKISLIIPALNEELSIGKVLREIPPIISSVIVVDNGCTDRTPEIARELKATVVREEKMGYGAACLKGISSLPEDTSIVVFMDADASDDPADMPKLLEPILKNEVDFVIGSRTLGKNDPGALPAHSRFGNILATVLIKLLFGASFSDLGPFRAIRLSTLKQFDMRDVDFGWTVEMQIKAAANNTPFTEVPVRYRKRIGQSKISGTLLGSLRAGYKILYMIFNFGILSKLFPRLYR